MVRIAVRWAAVLVAGFAVVARADEPPLHVRIDALLAEAHPAGQAPIASDADFLRRTHLALHGVIPTAAQARAFFADTAPDKRAKLVDALLADPQFAKWMAVRFDVMLMERRSETHTKAGPWREWLEQSFVANKPWDALVREMLAADGSDEKTRHAARWLLEREVDPNALAKDAARLFLGRDISCSQCHDHPRIDDYLQRDYAGLQAFFSRTYLFRPDTKKPGIVGEQAAGDTSYLSVFTKVGGGTKPRLPAEAELSEPPPGEWVVAPDAKDKNLRPIPKHSRRALLVAALGDGHHPAFRRNIANRLWAVVFGSGLVEPLDLHHSANPPSNPALLELLAAQIAAMKFDMRAFVRELALTQGFQRSLDLPSLPSQVAKMAAEKLPVLEQEAAALTSAAMSAEDEFGKAQKAVAEAQRAAAPLLEEQAKQDAEIAKVKKVADAAAADQKKSDDAVTAKRAARKTLADAAATTDEAGANPDAAAKALHGKIAAAEKELLAAEKDATAKKAVADAQAKALSEAQQKATAAKAKGEGTVKQIAAKQAELDAVAARKEAGRIKARHATRIAAGVKAALAWNTADAAEREAASRAASGFAAAKQDAGKIKADLTGALAQLSVLDGVPSAADAKPNAVRQLADVKSSLDRATAALTTAQKRLAILDAAAKEALAKANAAALPAVEAREALTVAWSRSFAAMELLPLAPEQLCWSAMQATGQIEMNRAASTKEWDAKNKLSDADSADPAKQAARVAGIEKLFREKLRGQEDQFVRFFGGAAGQPQTDFFATPEQALYFENGGVIRQWAGNLATRAAALPDPKAMAEEVYLSTLTRMPDEAEVASLAATLAARPPEKKADALGDFAWALLTSIEFRFAH